MKQKTFPKKFDLFSKIIMDIIIQSKCIILQFTKEIR